MRALKNAIAISASAAIAIACTGGVGGGGTGVMDHRDPSSSNEPGGSGREDPGPGQGSGGASGAQACPACETYTCTGTFASGTQTFDVFLKEVDGRCVVGTGTQKGAVFSCDGVISNPDGTTTTWTGDGSGGWSALMGNIAIACTPAPPEQTPTPGTPNAGDTTSDAG